MSAAISVDNIKVIDTDTHISEPPDLWTSRVPARWKDIVPKVVHNDATGHGHWRIGDYWLMGSGFYAVAGWKDYPPNGPQDLEHPDVDKGSWDPQERLKRMDEFGIYAQVLYPNLIGFETNQFIRLGTDVALACVEAYNDFQTEFASVDPKRFIPITMVPFWDLDASVREMKRCADMGHPGILFANKYEQIGMPSFTDEHWDPIYAAAQDMDLSVNFHVGFSSSTDGSAQAMTALLANFSARVAAVGTVMGLMSNGDSIAKIVTSGVCERFPKVNFVSVESGFGFLPYLLESLDWHWKGYGAHREAKSDLLPSEYFARQCYGTFWFETKTLPLLSTYPDNFMFETDYPHPTSMSPGPASPAELPRDHIAKHFADVDPVITRKVLHDNAARIYHLDS
jgi:predicted TIM-barrel fold metal-dependent hydrolase